MAALKAFSSAKTGPVRRPSDPVSSALCGVFFFKLNAHAKARVLWPRPRKWPVKEERDEKKKGREEQEESTSLSLQPHD